MEGLHPGRVIRQLWPTGCDLPLTGRYVARAAHGSGARYIDVGLFVGLSVGFTRASLGASLCWSPARSVEILVAVRPSSGALVSVAPDGPQQPAALADGEASSCCYSIPELLRLHPRLQEGDNARCRDLLGCARMNAGDLLRRACHARPIPGSASPRCWSAVL